jgi:tetratricopeptide (TPR) repeat protein
MKLLPLLILLSIGLWGCQSAKDLFQSPRKVDESLRKAQEVRILKAEKSLAGLDYLDSENQFKDYLKEYPVSVYTAHAYYGLARSLEFQEKWPEAIEVYRILAQQARELRPELSALAMYRLSYCYEALGDEVRTQATLMDAEGMALHLPMAVREVEIPARKAASLLRRGDFQAARKLLVKLNESVPAVFNLGESPNQSEMARVFLQIGSLSLRPLNEENFLLYIDAFENLQTYLWRSWSLNQSPWSERSRDQLVGSYQTLWNRAQDLEVGPKGLDAAAAARIRAETQRRWIGAIVKTSGTLRAYAGEENLGKSGPTPGLSEFLAQIEKQGDAVLFGQQELLPLTLESQQINSLKRAGTVNATPFFDVERKGSVK